MKCDELESYYYYEDRVFTPATHTYRVYHADEVDEAIAELKAVRKVHVEAIESMGAGLLQDGEEIRRLRRALWLARAYRAEARKNYWYARSCHEGDERLWSIDGSAVKYIGCIKRMNFDWLKVWSEVESKCLKKAEEYK